MTAFRFAFPALAALLTLSLGIAVAVFSPIVALSIASVAALLELALLILFFGREHLRFPKTWCYVALAGIFILSVTVALLLVESDISKIFIAVLAAAAIGRYAWTALIYFFFAERYRPYLLAASSQVVAILTVFFTGFDTSALTTYLALPPFISALGVFGLMAVVVTTGFVSYRIPFRRSFHATLAVGILFGELFGVTTLLPLPAAVAGALFALTFYATTGLARHAFSGSMERSVAYRYSLIIGVGLAIVLTTARWV